MRNKQHKQIGFKTVVGLILVLALVSAALLAPVLATHDPHLIDTENWLQPPGAGHFFGTDRLGRDIFSRVLYGARVSLAVGILAVVLAVIIGTVLGGFAGYYGGLADMAIMRFTDVVLAFPSLFLIITLVALFDAELWLVILIIGLTGWPRLARLVRGEFMRLRNTDFLVSARMLGSSHSRAMYYHLLPNALGPIIVSATLGVPAAILAEAGLGYFGLGAQPPVPTWGNMLRDAQLYIRQAWWYATFPGLCIFITVMAFNLLGDGLRGYFNPRQKV
ncbi:MAG: ABC transporter permease [Dethiobacter sp.]|jgi:peptide/nickel transport system permease protein|nr:ABC transporter permease [Dethiobacter sp.]